LITASTIALAVLILAIVFAIQALKIVPQQHAWVVERLGKFDRTLTPGLSVIIPFLDRVAYRHVLKEIPLDVPSQICITRDNTQLTVDGVLFFQVTDPMRASYGSSDYVGAITQLAQTTLRSVVGRMELDKTFEERDAINAAVVAALDEAARNWGVKVLRYEIKDLTPPTEILRAMQAQITAEREKRAVIATSEGRRQEQINLASGERESSIQRSEGERQAEINRAQGEAAAIAAIADATARAIERVAAAANQPGGLSAVNLRVADRYIDAFEKLARTNNTLILPSNLGDLAGLVAGALTVVRATPAHEGAPALSETGAGTGAGLTVPSRPAPRRPAEPGFGASQPAAS
jgi:regulator of protease activity HflC (stomatin/prohibitin superfamily)